MNINRGKQFEQAVRDSIEKLPYVTIIRLTDPQAKYKGICNPCDFICYAHNRMFMLECKCCYGNTMPFSMITNNQWNSMTAEDSKNNGVIAGILVWFIDHDITLFVSIRRLNILLNNGKKSINVNHLEELEGDYTVIGGVKKRIMFDYDMEQLFRGKI